LYIIAANPTTLHAACRLTVAIKSATSAAIGDRPRAVLVIVVTDEPVKLPNPFRPSKLPDPFSGWWATDALLATGALGALDRAQSNDHFVTIQPTPAPSSPIHTPPTPPHTMPHTPRPTATYFFVWNVIASVVLPDSRVLCADVVIGGVLRAGTAVRVLHRGVLEGGQRLAREATEAIEGIASELQEDELQAGPKDEDKENKEDKEDEMFSSARRARPTAGRARPTARRARPTVRPVPARFSVK